MKLNFLMSTVLLKLMLWLVVVGLMLLSVVGQYGLVKSLLVTRLNDEFP